MTMANEPNGARRGATVGMGKGSRFVRSRGLFVVVLVAGCSLSSLSPQARFSDSAFRLNDATRWGEVDRATPHVSARYRKQFLARHSTWGDRISIAEVEMAQLSLEEDKEHAVSEVVLSWYDASGVTIFKSSIIQRWEREHGTYRLVDERVKSGHPGVFADASKSPN
jgi:hypothetical protein